MATWSALGTTFNTTAGNKTIVVTPAVNDLIVVVAVTSGLSGGTTAVSDNNSGGAGTYVQVDSDRTGFSTTGTLTVWVRTALVTSATSTTVTVSQAGSTGGGGRVVALQGMTLLGSSAVRGNGGQSSGGAGTTPAPVLSQAPLTTNAILTAIGTGDNPPTPSKPAGYTNDSNAGYNTPTTGMGVGLLASGETNTTITWASTSTTAFASVAIEFDTSTGAAIFHKPLRAEQAVMRSNVY